MYKKERAWIRIAGNAKRIREGDQYGWRCFVDGSLEEIPLIRWDIAGSATQKNFKPGTNPDGNEQGIVAWIDFFGNIAIDKGTAHIELLNPAAT
ncbi:MAG: hypothetical protein HY435_00055 [Candidatus Liptonbacteria bacterium]|nr:hypothetical protein [Candidatus Liptonbacteria bacterium]